MSQQKFWGFKENIQLVKFNDSAAFCNRGKQQKDILLDFIPLWSTQVIPQGQQKKKKKKWLSYNLMHKHTCRHGGQAVRENFQGRVGNSCRGQHILTRWREKPTKTSKNEKPWLQSATTTNTKHVFINNKQKLTFSAAGHGALKRPGNGLSGFLLSRSLLQRHRAHQLTGGRRHLSNNETCD